MHRYQGVCGMRSRILNQNRKEGIQHTAMKSKQIWAKFMEGRIRR